MDRQQHSNVHAEPGAAARRAARAGGCACAPSPLLLVLFVCFSISISLFYLVVSHF